MVERQGPVGWLVFDRPEVGNAMNATMLAEPGARVAELDADPAVRVIVNTGEGRGFRPASTWRNFSRDPRHVREQSRRRICDATLKLTGVAPPGVEAGDRGGEWHVRGGGLHFVADADIVIAATTPPSSTPTCRSGR